MGIMLLRYTMASSFLWLSVFTSIATFFSPINASSDTFSSEQTTYTEQVCQFDWECRNLTEQASRDHVAMYSNSSINGTLETEAPVYVCCNANVSSTTTDYGYADDSENEEMSPGVCCVQEALPLWVTILLVIIFFILCTGCCVLCCVVRPKLEALMRRFETPRINSNTIQTMAALKVLSTDTTPGANQNANQGQGLFTPAPSQPVAYTTGAPTAPAPNYPTQPPMYNSQQPPAAPPSPYMAAPPYPPQGAPNQPPTQPGYPQPGYPFQPQPGYPPQPHPQQPPYPTNYGLQYPTQAPYPAPQQAPVSSNPKPQMTVEVPSASAA